MRAGLAVMNKQHADYQVVPYGLIKQEGNEEPSMFKQIGIRTASVDALVG